MREQSLNANVAFRAALAGQLDVGRYSVLLKQLLHCHLRLDRDQSKSMIDEMSEREYEKHQSGIKPIPVHQISVDHASDATSQKQ